MKFVSLILITLFVGLIVSTSGAQETPPQKSACPSDMVEIEGDYCPNVEQRCLYNVDINGNKLNTPPDPTWSCGEFAQPSVCLSDHKIHMHFCIDKYEWPNKEGQIPQDWMSWYDAKKATAAAGKRLCTAREWTFAAEGPSMHPIPYGDGFHRNNQICNIDRKFSETPDVKIDVFKAQQPNDVMAQALRAYLVPSGSKPECHSDFGVYDMAGNIDEWVENTGGITSCPAGKKCWGWISGLKGGHIWHVRQASRPMTDAHGPTFAWYETGTRACKDVQ